MCFGYTIEEGVRVDKNGIAFFKMDSPSRVVNFNLIDNENDFLETSSHSNMVFNFKWPLKRCPVPKCTAGTRLLKTIEVFSQHTYKRYNIQF